MVQRRPRTAAVSRAIIEGSLKVRTQRKKCKQRSRAPQDLCDRGALALTAPMFPPPLQPLPTIRREPSDAEDHPTLYAALCCCHRAYISAWAHQLIPLRVFAFHRTAEDMLPLHVPCSKTHAKASRAEEEEGAGTEYISHHRREKVQSEHVTLSPTTSTSDQSPRIPLL